MARQRSKRPRKDDPSPPEPRHNGAKRAKTGHGPRQQHREIQTYHPSPSLPQDNHADLPSTKEEEHSPIAVAGQPNPDLERKTDDHQTITPAPPATDTRLTRENLAKLNSMSSNLPSRDTFQALGEGSGHTNPTDPKASVSAPALTSALALEEEDDCGTAESEKGGPYPCALYSILHDSGINIHGDDSMLADLEELRRERSVRPSLAPSECSDGEIKKIFRANTSAAGDLDIQRDVVTAIVGCGNHLNLCHASDVPWDNIESMTGNLADAPQPSLYYGPRYGDVPQPIRTSQGISDLIQPARVYNAPIAPHFVMEVTGPTGRSFGRYDILECQAAHSAAATARAVLTIENLGVDEPEYDDTAKAHVWTYIWLPGVLTQYAMRVGRPEPGSSEPSYHLTRIKMYHIMESVDEFRKGVSAFRHCRDESHAKNEARLAEAYERYTKKRAWLAEAYERLRRCSQQTSQQTSHPVPGSTTLPVPPCLPESHPGPERNPSFENDVLLDLDQQLQQDCEASCSNEAAPGPSSSSTAAVITTSMTSASTHVTKASLPHDGVGASSSKQISVSKSRPQRTRRPPKRFGMVDS
ncbi:hypothetical protein N0V85_008957 [Neurospora sp. IMI 360204]|nr:hypothetical protein N0V85_008957 [Neurospora sp. IMI 360204]